MENWNKNEQEEKDLKVACNCNGRFNLYFLGNSKLQVEMKWLEGMICQIFLTIIQSGCVFYHLWISNHWHILLKFQIYKLLMRSLFKFSMYMTWNN